MRIRPWSALSFIFLSLSLVSPALGQTIPRDIRLQILEAVVQIVPFDAQAGETAPWSGSGTIISPEGYILTNFHVIGDMDTRAFHEWHAVLVTDPAFTDQPPQLRYWARHIASDPTHDLAILKIEQDADETPIPRGTTFPSVAVGDSNALIPGDALVIVGYPGISGSTITFTSGTMSGWVGEDFETGGKQWIKTDAKIAYGNSGGAAFNLEGHLVGVPTAGRTVEYDESDVEEQAYVRPIGLAWAMIGPNVATVRRASNITAPVAAPALPTVTPAPARTAGSIGALELGQTAMGELEGSSRAATYHTYWIDVPAGTESVVVRMSADADLDLAAKVGAEIDSYSDDGNWDHRDNSTSTSAEIVIHDPRGRLYIDVFNALGDGVVGTYELEVR